MIVDRGKEGKGGFQMGMSVFVMAAASDCKDIIGSFWVLLAEEGRRAVNSTMHAMHEMDEILEGLALYFYVIPNICT
jgi:hypothetical protein